MKTLAAIIFCMSCTPALSSMRCTITAVYQNGEQGDVVASPLESYIKAESAVVDLASGVIYHGQFGNEYYPNRVIIDRGSSVSAFKVLSTSNPNLPTVTGEHPYTSLTYFEIQMFADGPTKPFIAVAAGTVGYGNCSGIGL